MDIQVEHKNDLVKFSDPEGIEMYINKEEYQRLRLIADDFWDID